VESTAPAWGDARPWRVAAHLTDIGSGEEPEAQLYLVEGATRLSDGTIAVANGGTGEIRFFDPLGRFVQAVGGIGGGPGEFRMEDGPGLRFLTHLDGDTLLAWDLLAQRVSVFSSEGALVRSTRLGSAAGMYFMRGVLRDGSVVLALLDAAEPRGGAAGCRRQVERLVRFGAGGDSLNLVGDFPGAEYCTSAIRAGLDLRLSPPWGRSLHVATAGERVYVGTGDSWQVAVYDGAGRLQRLIRRASQPLPLTPDLAARLTVRTAEEVAAKAPGGLRSTLEKAVNQAMADAPRPTVLPPYSDLLVDADLNLWVKSFGTSMDEPSQWTVFSEEGVWLGTVALPQGLEPLEIGTDFVLGEERDVLGVEHIVAYPLEKEGT
jgi:hypothetical protein